MINHCVIAGNMGSNPEVRTLSNGNKVANFTIANTQKYKGKDGNTAENTTWVKVTAFGPPAGIAEKFLEKGSFVTIEGRWSSRKYTDKNGNDVNVTELVVEKIHLHGKSQKKEDQPDTSMDDNDDPF
jgi:single-strand DNA-binding protein